MRVGGLVLGGAPARRRAVDLGALAPAVLEHAIELEGHADNVAASLLRRSRGDGGRAASCGCRWRSTRPSSCGSRRRRRRPSARATACRATVSFADAAFNVGRTALLVAALGRGRRRGAALGDGRPAPPGPPPRRVAAVARCPRRRPRRRRVVRLAVGQRPGRRLPGRPGGRRRRSSPRCRPTATPRCSPSPTRRTVVGPASSIRRHAGRQAVGRREAAGEDERLVGEGAGERATGLGRRRRRRPAARRRSSRRRGRRRGGRGRRPT